MKRIDFHVHFDGTDPEKIAGLAELGRHHSCMMAMIGGVNYGGYDFIPNDEVLKWCRKYPDVFIPMAKIDLWDKVYTDEVYRCKDAGFRGVKFIYPYYEYDHDLYMPVYEACEKCDLPVLFHTGEYRAHAYDAVVRRPVLRNMAPITLDRIARSFPKLNIVMAHMGTRIWRFEGAELIRMHDNLYADLAGSGNWQGVLPAELHNLLCPQPLTSCARRGGIYRNYRKLIFGSDAYVMNHIAHIEGMDHYERMLMLNAVPDDIRQEIMGGTVARWLGIELD